MHPFRDKCAGAVNVKWGPACIRSHPPPPPPPRSTASMTCAEGNLNGTALVLQFDEYGVATRDTGFVTFAPYSKDGQGLSPVYGGYSNRIINPYLYLSNGADPMQLLYQASEGNCWYGACIKTYEEGDAVLQIIQPRKSLASPPRPLLMNIDTHQFLSVDFFCYDKELKGLKLHQVKIDPIDFTFKNPKENYIVLPDDCVNVGSTYPLVINNLSMGKKKEGGARASTIVVKKKMELENAEMGNVPIITA
eukprot:TRINITY_DN239_c0_g1_i2.p1 TRINITY_DN239_c0_g1~~TRINITY_DN239_c0_g1_i2.p1  ORF type:complete len:249 (-),score=40.82 TRINITY_DN239_c0_g1_i2:329-1075(-)